MKRLTIILLKIYKNVFSGIFVNLFGYGCRFNPTCGDYAVFAVEKHGVVRGLSLSLKRLTRCHPFSGKYYDPVPKKLLK